MWNAFQMLILYYNTFVKCFKSGVEIKILANIPDNHCSNRFILNEILLGQNIHFPLVSLYMICVHTIGIASFLNRWLKKQAQCLAATETAAWKQI